MSEWPQPRARQRLFDLAARFGMAGQRDYRRFIILGRGRSGSNFLATSLASHPNVVAFGELFNNVAQEAGRIGWSYPGFRTHDARDIRLREERPLEFIDEKVFRPMPAGIRAVGFKLFYFHARDPGWAPVWDHLRELGVAAIHLKRRNLFESLVSAEVAKQTSEWSSRTAGKSGGTVPPLQLDYDICRTYFEKTVAHQQAHSALFASTFDLDYEDLVADYEGATTRIQEFLGVPHARLSSPLQKQRSLPMRKRVANYDELAALFAGSPWAPFFDE